MNPSLAERVRCAPIAEKEDLIKITEEKQQWRRKKKQPSTFAFTIFLSPLDVAGVDK